MDIIKLWDNVLLPLNETGIVVDILDIPWGFKYVVMIKKGTFNQKGQLIKFKLEQLKPVPVEINITELQIKAEVELSQSLINRYGSEVPRFTVHGMNQAEFIGHISATAFNAGWTKRSIRERSDVVEFLNLQLNWEYKGTREKGNQIHYGKQELRELLDFIFGTPNNVDEELLFNKGKHGINQS